MTYFEKMYRRLHRIIFKLFSLTYEGVENIPTDTPNGLIVCANHTSMYDPVVIIAAMHMPIRYMAKAELCKIPLLKQLIESFGAYPIKRGASDVSAIKKTVELLKEGQVVGIFPQGTRTPGSIPTPDQAKSGLGLTAYRSGADILPVYIQTEKYKVKMFHKTHIVIGKPIANSDLGFTDGSIRQINAASQRAFGYVCDMAKERS